MGKYEAGATEKAARAAEAAAATQQAEIAKQQWAIAQPIQQQMAAQLSQPVEQQSYFKRMIGGLEKSYGDVAANTARTLGGRYQYGSGYEGEAAKNVGLSKAGARAGAWQSGEEARLSGLATLAGAAIPAAQQGYSSAASTYSDIAQQKLTERATKAGQQTGAVTSICCFNFMEAEGDIADDVREYRDTFYSSNSDVAKGYRIMAKKLVPLMRKDPEVKQWVRENMTQPMIKFAEWFYGKNDYGYLCQPKCLYWVKVWGEIGRKGGEEYTWEEFWDSKKASPPQQKMQRSS